MHCRICAKELFYTHSDTSQLLDHIHSEHAEAGVVGFGNSNGNIEMSPSARGSLLLRKNSSDWVMHLLQSPEGRQGAFPGGKDADDDVRQTQSSRSGRESRESSAVSKTTASDGMVRGNSDRRTQRPRYKTLRYATVV